MLTLENPVDFELHQSIRYNTIQNLDNICSPLYYFRPVCLPPIGLDLTNKDGVTVGWGLTALEEYRTTTSCDLIKGEADRTAIPTKLKKINLK